jgi:hypothetical protein
MSNTKGKRIFRYRLSPETFGYTLVFRQRLVVTYPLTPLKSCCRESQSHITTDGRSVGRSVSQSVSKSAADSNPL